MIDSTLPLSFADFGLDERLLRAVNKLGFEHPTAIQTTAIPALLSGRDLVAQSETGTGKTAAFALPFLSRIDLEQRVPQLLVLTPTRELAIQVSEAVASYATSMKRFSVAAVYGGQDYGVQLRQLGHGVHCVVGTPGRLMDLMRRGALKLDAIAGLVIDEADEMLRMGFIEDVEWILSQTPEGRQIALFSATMPPPIRAIAARYLSEPLALADAQRATAAASIRQRCCVVGHPHKLEALKRFLEATPFDAALVFTRTKAASLEVAEALVAAGIKAAPLNGDLAQNLRERTVERLKSGLLDVLVATDVAARGLDVERISHVINFELPNDTEAYVHRIGRTGRAGRTGESLLIVSPQEMGRVGALERTTRQRIERVNLPSVAELNEQRKRRFAARIEGALGAVDRDDFRGLLEAFLAEHAVDPLDIAAALARLVQGEERLLLKELPVLTPSRQTAPRQLQNRRKSMAVWGEPEQGMERYRLAVGRTHGVRPANIVGAIANEARLDSAFIGRIEINEDYSTVDLPQGMPHKLLSKLQRARVCNRQLGLAKLSAEPRPARASYGAHDRAAG